MLLHKGIGFASVIGRTHRSVLPDVVRAVTQRDWGGYSVTSDASEQFTRRYLYCYTSASVLLLHLI